MTLGAAVGARLRQWRHVEGYASRLAARLVGAEHGVILAYESGDRVPSVARMRELCLLYGVSADALLGLGECAECGRTCEASEAKNHCRSTAATATGGSGG